MEAITMPKLSEGMEEGTILTWLVHDGQEIAVGDELVEIETDKAVVAHLAERAGFVHIVVGQGARCPVGAVIAELSAVPLDDVLVAAGAPSAASDVPGDAPTPAAGPAAPPISHVPATPMARRLAALHAIDLATVSGTGPRRRITRGDVLAAAGLAAPVPAAPRPAERVTSAGPPPAATAPESSTVALTRLQRVVADRMTASKATVPHFQVQAEVVLDELLRFRDALRGVAGDSPVPTLNDLIIKASARALRQHPLANGSFSDQGYRLHSRVNVGFAVAGEQALVVPTVFDADTASLGAIAQETRRLADRVRTGKVSPDELAGGTFTVSNLGMYGMSAIYPVINAPQAAILGVGAARAVLARIDGEIVERQVATLTLSCDHRILYGAEAAMFLATIKAGLEQPVGLVL